MQGLNIRIEKYNRGFKKSFVFGGSFSLYALFHFVFTI
jgi:hypothetical protein